MSFDGTSKSVEQSPLITEYWQLMSPYMEEVKAKVIAKAEPESLAFLDLDNLKGPSVVCNAATLTDDEWVARRKDCIGGSDCSTVFGENHFKDNLQLYYEKIGQQPVSPSDENLSWESERAKSWGHCMESYIADSLQWDYEGSEIFVDTNIYAHEKYPFIQVNLDRMQRLPDGSFRIIEIKTANTFVSDAWKDGSVPIPYIYQVRVYMAVMNLWECTIRVLIGKDPDAPNAIQTRKITRDLDEEARILQGLDEFWTDHVQCKVPPKPIGKADLIVNTIAAYDGPQKEATVQLTSDIEDDFVRCEQLKAEYTSAKRIADAAEEKYKQAQIPLVLAVGNSTVGNLTSSDGKSLLEVTYRAGTPRTTIDSKKLKELFPDAYTECTVQGKQTRRFSIKRRMLK